MATSTKGVGTTDGDGRGGLVRGVVGGEVDGEGRQLGKGLSGRNGRWSREIWSDEKEC